MKLTVVLPFLLGIAVALEPAGLGGRASQSQKRSLRSRLSSSAETLRAPNTPRGSPSGYTTSVVEATLLRQKADLKIVPAEFAQLQKLRRQASAADFFECTNPNPSPASADCRVVVDQVLSTNDELIIAPNACMVFSYQTCQAFFCSLCQKLATSTGFIGTQLDTVDALCVQNGQAGTIVGEDAPQWDAGFTYLGDSLPTFDVC